MPRPNRWWALTPSCVALAVVLSLQGIAWAGTGVWQTGGPFGGDVVILAIDPKTPTTLYAAAGGRVFKSIDSGDTWLVSSPHLGLQFRGLAIDPATPTTLYANVWENGGRIFKSTDAGGTWALVNLASPYGAVQVLALAIDPVTPTTVYVGARVDVPMLDTWLFKSTDSGRTWSSSLVSFGIFALAVNPATPSTLYATDGVASEWKSIDSGLHWGPNPSGPGAAALRSVAFDPAAPTTLYAPTTAGVVKSTDAGVTWAPANTGLTNVDIIGLTVDHVTPTTVYVATPAGFFKSVDAADHWVAVSTQSRGGAVTFDPVTPTTAFGWGGGFDGVSGSTDAGNTWIAANRGLRGLNLSVPALVVAATSPATAYAATASGLFWSTDAGGTWAAADTSLTNIGALATDPTTPATLYAGMLNGAVYKSTDGGVMWTSSNAGLYSVLALAIDPATPATSYAAGLGGIAKSTNAGSTWFAANGGLTNPATETVTSLAIDTTTPTTLYAGMSAGVFKSTDAGVTWATTSLSGSSVRSLAIDPLKPSTLYAGTGGGVFSSMDSGASWTALVPANVNSLAIDPANPETIYAGTLTSGVLKSSNSGATWAPFNSGLPEGEIHALALDPTGATTLYAGVAAEGVWQSRGSTGAFHTVTPCRTLDTRTADGPALAAGGGRTFTVVGRCGIPADARSVSLNVTATGATSPGHLVLYPAGSAVPSNSSLNYSADQTRANNAVSLLGAAGDLSILAAQGLGSVHLIVDVNGYFK